MVWASSNTQRVERMRRADHDRRRVRTQNPRARRRASGAPRPARSYRATAAMGGLSMFVGGVLYLLGTVAWGTASLVAVGATAVVGYAEYRMQLAEVRRTGQPISDDPAPVKAEPEAEPAPLPADDVPDDVEPVAEPEPVDLDGESSGDQPSPRRTTRTEPPPRPARRAQASDPAHPGCQASERRFCRCPDGPNRGGKASAAKKTTAAKKPPAKQAPAKTAPKPAAKRAPTRRTR